MRNDENMMKKKENKRDTQNDTPPSHDTATVIITMFALRSVYGDQVFMCMTVESNHFPSQGSPSRLEPCLVSLTRGVKVPGVQHGFHDVSPGQAAVALKKESP